MTHYFAMTGSLSKQDIQQMSQQLMTDSLDNLWATVCMWWGYLILLLILIGATTVSFLAVWYLIEAILVPSRSNTGT